MNQGSDIAYAAGSEVIRLLPGGGRAPVAFGTPCPVTDQEEPEIVQMYAAHYRALLNLGTLDERQRIDVSNLLSKCEMRLHPDGGGAAGPMAADRFRSGAGAKPSAEEPARSRCRLLQEHESCLTAIRLYAAGARRALAKGDLEAVRFALERIDAQAVRAGALLQAVRIKSDAT